MIDILMPRLSDTMTEGTIAVWHKKPGDAVQPGDILVEIETDKALMEQEAYDGGILVEILVPEGELVEIGTPIARLDAGRDPATPPVAVPVEQHPVEPEPDSADPAPGAGSDAPMSSGGDDITDRRLATPLVRRLAREHGIDLKAVSGTGPGGRIVRADLERAEETSGAPTTSAPTPSSTAPQPIDADARASTRVPFDGVRQVIASRLTMSATTIPTFTATASIDVGDLLRLRAEINTAHADAGVRVSVNDLLVRAVALALRAHPTVNASYDPDGSGAALLHGRVHVGVAVASPAGLVVPVVRDADRASVTAIATTTRELVGKASERRLTHEELRDGTFTISNLGMFGVDHFTAIINPPQGAILAVGAVREEAVPRGDELVARKVMSATLTSDHRIIDGADAARFLSTLRDLLQHPLRVVS